MNILCLLVYVSAAVIMDLQSYKVSNRLIIAGLLTGCILQMMKGGWSGLVFCMSGVLLPLIILWPVFLLHILGAGDVKLFSVIGSMMGPRFVLTSMLYKVDEVRTIRERRKHK
ncbi:MAG: hypothetical protein GX567_08545 [Clostridia bacterium]|nr:hypothetical protein [Clostridia bacterium]